MARLDELRLISEVARMYYDQGIRQQEIKERLNLHQSKVSRLLKWARETNVVRISVIGIELASLKRARRVVGVAGGTSAGFCSELVDLGMQAHSITPHTILTRSLSLWAFGKPSAICSWLRRTANQWNESGKDSSQCCFRNRKNDDGHD